MAEAVVNVVVEQLVSATTEWLTGEISLIAGVRKELENMKAKMKIIQKVLNDAENRSVKDEFVKGWLDKVQDTAYDMEDVLDEWNTRVLIQRGKEDEEKPLTEISSSSSSLCKFTCCSFKKFDCFSTVKQVGWRRNIALRIKEINERMNSLFSEMEQFKLVSNLVGNDGMSKEIDNFDICRTTTSLVDKSQVHGRDDDKDLLLSKVLSKNSDEHNGPDVISIVGVGGLGKTTLAQLVYNDDKVKEKFDKRIWICVSNSFDEVRVAQGILEIVNKDKSRLNHLDALHTSIKESLSKEKYLLVLDDVWNEDFKKWERLRLCLMDGNLESKVLVTTRNEQVARIMGTAPSNIFKPELISDHDCWLLMKHIAFQGKTEVDPIFDELEDIGKEIAKKCKGLPLAAKTLGGLLQSKDGIVEWKEVLYSEIWELEIAELELFPHLFLSYKELSPSLKRCFSFYAIFPKDTRLEIQELISFWMAHGYINPMTKTDDVVQMGREYFGFLASRAFFNQTISQFANEYEASMHDIMHDFAQYISGDEFLIVRNYHNDDNNSSVSASAEYPYAKSMKARHLSIEGSINPTSICDVGKLRTCLTSYVPKNVTLDLLKQLKLVKALYLVHCDLEQVPEDIRNLIHLRILNLRDNPLRELTEAVGDLYNLQRLCLEELPNLSTLPQSVGKLNNLVFLAPTNFVMHESAESDYELGLCNLRLFKKLNQLRGALKIEFNSDFSDEDDAKEAELRRKKYITELAFNFNDHQVSDNVVAALQAPPNVQLLQIRRFQGTKLPSWITSLNNLSELRLCDAENVLCLPPFGKLQSLKKLLICRFSALKSIGREFLGIDNRDNNNVCAFPKLEILVFSKCHELTKWEDLKSEEENAIVMPVLRILHFRSCKNLYMLPQRLLRRASFLKILVIEYDRDGKDEEVEDFEDFLETSPAPEKVLGISGNHSSIQVTTWISHLDCFTMLAIADVKEAFLLPSLGKLPSLERLLIKDCSGLKLIGREFLGIDNGHNSEKIVSYPNLVELGIAGCNELQEWEDLESDDADAVTVMPKLGVLRIEGCPKMKVLPHWLLGKLSSLIRLSLPDCEPPLNFSIKGEELVEGVDDVVQLPPYLQLLRIEYCKGSELHNWVLSLNYLTKLDVWHAKDVSSLPAFGKLPFLKKLYINKFSILELMGRGFVGIDNNTSNGFVAFPELERLRIHICDQLKSWEDIKPEEDDTITVMPKLKVLSIAYCCKLEVLPFRLLIKAASLETLRIDICESSLDVLKRKHTEPFLRLRGVLVLSSHPCSCHKLLERGHS